MSPTLKPHGVLESVLYADDLEAARDFYENVIGLTCFSAAPGRDLFFRCGDQVVIVFNPGATSLARPPGSGRAPPHGAFGQGHLAFKAKASELDDWRARLTAAGLEIEADFEWSPGLRSIYVRDPAGNSVEIADERLWDGK
jgi:catechol 2,3-dioxygenase-like lactoylglutathione lyase family enzyme